MEAKSVEVSKRAHDAFKRGKKHVTKTFFHRRPDWEQGAREFREAVKYYKMAGEMFEEQLMEALQESSNAHRELPSGGLHTAGQDMEMAAEIFVKRSKESADAKFVERAIKMYKDAANLYQANGELDRSAQVLIALAYLLEECKQVDTALSVANDACAVFESGDRGMFSEDTFSKAVMFSLKADRVTEAISFIERQNAIFRKHVDTFERSLYKNLLSLIVLYFHLGDFKLAKQKIHEFQSVENFAASEEMTLGLELVAAYESGSNEALEETLKKGPFKFLNTAVTETQIPDTQQICMFI